VLKLTSTVQLNFTTTHDYKHRLLTTWYKAFLG